MSNSVVGPKLALFPTTMLAGAAIVANRAVKRGADLDSCVPATANTINLGIACEDQDTIGRAIEIAHRPGELVTVEAGAAFALDANLTSDANSRLVAATTGQNVIAIARQAATASGDLVVAELRFMVAP